MNPAPTSSRRIRTAATPNRINFLFSFFSMPPASLLLYKAALSFSEYGPSFPPRIVTFAATASSLFLR